MTIATDAPRSALTFDATNGIATGTLAIPIVGIDPPPIDAKKMDLSEFLKTGWVTFNHGSQISDIVGHPLGAKLVDGVWQITVKILPTIYEKGSKHLLMTVGFDKFYLSVAQATRDPNDRAASHVRTLSIFLLSGP